MIDKNNYKHIGEFIKEKRLDKNLSLRGLSSLAHISHTEINHIEKGTRENINTSNIFRICKGLDLDYNEIAITFELPMLSDTTESIIAADPTFRSNNIDNEYLYDFLLNELCKGLSTRNNIKVSTDMFIEEYRANNFACFDYVCMTDDAVIGTEFIHINKNFSALKNKVKSLFADFYFSFKHLYSDDKMFFTVFLIVEGESLLQQLDTSFKNYFYYFKPILNIVTVPRNDTLNYINNIPISK